MTPNDENLKRLEDFLAATEHQTKEEALTELATNGIDVVAFQNRINSLVRKGYQNQIKFAAQVATKDSAAKKTLRFGDLVSKPMSELRAIFERVRAGEFGVGFQQAAVARCRNLQGNSLSESELRSWLEDISTMDEQ